MKTMRREIRRRRFKRRNVMSECMTVFRQLREHKQIDSLTPVSRLLSPALQKMKVHPEMFMKTKEGEK
jgi:hypothetical protein